MLKFTFSKNAMSHVSYVLQLENTVTAVYHVETKQEATVFFIANHVWSKHHGEEVIGFVLTCTGWQAWPVCSA